MFSSAFSPTFKNNPSIRWWKIAAIVGKNFLNREINIFIFSVVLHTKCVQDHVLASNLIPLLLDFVTYVHTVMQVRQKDIVRNLWRGGLGGVNEDVYTVERLRIKKKKRQVICISWINKEYIFIRAGESWVHLTNSIPSFFFIHLW